MQIAFPSDDPKLFAEQLEYLSRKKKPTGAWVVADANPTRGKLIVELADAGALSPAVEPVLPASPLSQALTDAVEKSVWNLRRSDAKRRDFGTASAGNEIRILCIHGVGHGDVDKNLVSDWTKALTVQLAAANSTLQPKLDFLKYDHLFEHSPHNVLTYAEAFLSMGWSGVSSIVSDLFGTRRGIGGVSEALRWTAGMVAQWSENEDLRAGTRLCLVKAIADFNPDVVVAHSLGSLISYDTFSRVKDDSGKPWDGAGLINGRFYVTFGSQIGSRFTRNTLGGRVQPLNARHWFHLFNKHDNAFAAELKIGTPNFDQIITTFDIEGMLNHEATQYLNHKAAFESCWRNIALAQPPPPASRRKTKSGTETNKAEDAERFSILKPIIAAPPGRRALLVGINDYPNASDRLEGCLNDVFLMSSLLQENGFMADDIRVVLNDRATAKGIVDRLEWLLDGADDGMERVFYYAGHGAQIPGYGVGEKVDRKDECLVPYDFDWSREHAVTDDQFYDLYSQLPYNTLFCAILDCCHSGGMAREGGLKVRGLTPPDDIRHRALKWSENEQMWVSRDLAEVSKSNGKLLKDRRKHAKIFGEEGDENRLFRASVLRPDDKDFDKARKAYGHYGPFMPVILQSCQESQFSHEYRHGVTSYGAFTYSFAQYIRERRKSGSPVRWEQLVVDVGAKLKRLRYDQKPGLVCPASLKKAPVPWGA
jgi:hypothetical protein